MIARIRKGNDFKHIWPITWNGQPEDFSDATDITLTAKVYGQVKTLTEGVDYHIDGGTVVVDFTPAICDITGTYTIELNYIKPSAEFIDGDRRSAVDVQAFQIVDTSAEANATEGVSLPSEAMAAYALKYDDLTEAQKDELRGKGITSIDLTGEVGDTKTYTITYADGLTFDFSVTDGHTPIFEFVGTVLHIDGVAGPDLKGETGNGIASVELTSTVGLVKTYTITFTDATTTTFTVTDGATAVVQEKGSNTSVVMSQKAVTDELDQLAGDVSLLDAVHSDKIRDIENVLSSANLGQSAQLSVSGVSPLSLPKNAANGGMQVKLEGLTEDVGGVITNFDPTGRVRSVGKNLLKLNLSKESISLAKFHKIDDSSFSYERISGSYTDPVTIGEVNVVQGEQYDMRLSNAGVGVIGLGIDSENGNIRPLSSMIATGDNIGTSFVATGTKLTLRIAGLNRVYTPSIVSNIRLVKGVTTIPYEPYKETNLYLTAPELRSNGTVKDEIRKGANGYELVKRISDVDGTVLATPVISPISYGGILNSAESGTVYHEPVIADAGVYGTNMPILLTDYPIATIEELIKHENGIDTYLNAASAVIASDGLSFTHPDLTDGDLVLFTYAFDKESTNGNITATFYDSNVVKIDTVTDKAYKITDVVTNGVLTRTLTEV